MTKLDEIMEKGKKDYKPSEEAKAKAYTKLIMESCGEEPVC